MLKKVVKIILPLIWLSILIYSASIYFENRGPGYFEGTDFKTFAQLIFPLAGLIAFNMLYLQFMLGSSMEWWQKLYPGARRFHMKNGIFVFLFTFIHPFLIFLGFGLEKYFFRTFLPENLRFFALLGQLAFYTMVVTVGTALLRNVKFLQFIWRKIHILNYAVFGFAWIHSWNIGSDIQSTNLRFIWIFYGLTALLSAAGKLYRTSMRAKSSDQ